jgi:hypothetical protein
MIIIMTRPGGGGGGRRQRINAKGFRIHKALNKFFLISNRKRSNGVQEGNLKSRRLQLSKLPPNPLPALSHLHTTLYTSDTQGRKIGSLRKFHIIVAYLFGERESCKVRAEKRKELLSLSVEFAYGN